MDVCWLIGGMDEARSVSFAAGGCLDSSLLARAQPPAYRRPQAAAPAHLPLPRMLRGDRVVGGLRRRHVTAVALVEELGLMGGGAGPQPRQRIQSGVFLTQARAQAARGMIGLLEVSLITPHRPHRILERLGVLDDARQLRDVADDLAQGGGEWRIDISGQCWLSCEDRVVATAQFPVITHLAQSRGHLPLGAALLQHLGLQPGLLELQGL